MKSAGNTEHNRMTLLLNDSHSINSDKPIIHIANQKRKGYSLFFHSIVSILFFTFSGGNLVTPSENKLDRIDHADAAKWSRIINRTFLIAFYNPNGASDH